MFFIDKCHFAFQCGEQMPLEVRRNESTQMKNLFDISVHGSAIAFSIEEFSLKSDDVQENFHRYYFNQSDRSDRRFFNERFDISEELFQVGKTSN